MQSAGAPGGHPRPRLSRLSHDSQPMQSAAGARGGATRSGLEGPNRHRQEQSLRGPAGWIEGAKGRRHRLSGAWYRRSGRQDRGVRANRLLPLKGATPPLGSRAAVPSPARFQTVRGAEKAEPATQRGAESRATAVGEDGPQRIGE